MRRRFSCALLVIASVAVGVATSIPARAAGGDKTTYLAAECQAPQILGTFWFTGQNGKIAHRRGGASTDDPNAIWIWGSNGWEPAGSDTVTINFNGDLATGVSAWGDFLLKLGSIGDFAGAWAWGKNAVYGRGSGNGIVGTAAEGNHVTVTWMRAQPDAWGVDPFPGCSLGEPYIFLEIEVIDPHQ